VSCSRRLHFIDPLVQVAPFAPSSLRHDLLGLE
jgi:hypothetical protein